MPHWHFFTANGEFGSLDMNRQRVDDGGWRIVAAETLAINGTRFEFHVDGDELRIDPKRSETARSTASGAPKRGS